MTRIPFVSRRGRDTEDTPRPETDSRVPAWIDQVPRVGWPIVAVIAMVMCAPGEHHLAVMAGYEDRILGVQLAWGMPACLVAYAGIAASVATRRVKGSQGRRTAVAGAFLSLGAAMSAQPISHMFVTGHWASDPSPVWIVWSVSVVPPLVVGHLMHMAASHTVSRRKVSALSAAVPVPARTTEEKELRAVPASRPAVPSPADKDRTASAVSRAFNIPGDMFQDTVPALSLSHPGRPALSTPSVSRPAVPSLGDRQSMSARAVVLLSEGHSEDTVRDTLRDEYTTEDGTVPKTNSISKAVTRAKDKVSRAS